MLKKPKLNLPDWEERQISKDKKLKLMELELRRWKWNKKWRRRTSLLNWISKPWELQDRQRSELRNKKWDLRVRNFLKNSKPIEPHQKLLELRKPWQNNLRKLWLNKESLPWKELMRNKKIEKRRHLKCNHNGSKNKNLLNNRRIDRLQLN